MDSEAARRFSVESQCRGKRTYASKREAKRAARRSERFTTIAGRLHPYRCPHCSRIHLGHRLAPRKLDWSA